MDQYFGDSGLSGRVGDAELEEIVMSEQAKLPSSEVGGWKKAFLGFSLGVFLIFWLGVLTDYSWYDNQIHVLFSALVLCVSTATFLMLNFWGKSQRLLTFLICILTFLTALLSVPFHRYHSSQIPIQVETSPDGLRVVEVYCSFTPAHNTGFDHIEIIIRNRHFPFIQRDLGLYNNYSPRHCTGGVNSLVNWTNNNTIYVVERQAYLNIDHIHWEGVIADPGEINGNN